MQCSHCGAELPEGSTFCSRCGNPLASTEDPYVVAQRRYWELQERLRRREIDQDGGLIGGALLPEGGFELFERLREVAALGVVRGVQEL